MNKELKQLVELVKSKGKYEIIESKYHKNRWIIFDKVTGLAEENITSHLLKIRLRQYS
jgi:hypothetical protein